MEEDKWTENSGGSSVEHSSNRHVFIFAAVMVCLGFIVALIISNTHHVTINWIVAKTNISLIWVVLISLAVGWVGGFSTKKFFELIRYLRS